MNTKFLTLVTVALLFSSISFAKIFRVGYKGLPLSGVDFDDFQPAHDVAKAGDTLQIYGSVLGYPSVSKKLVIVGFGYNFDVNSGLQIIGTDAPSSFNQLTFGAGSNGTLISGISGTFVVGGELVGTPISDITFQRCRGTFYFLCTIDYADISNIKLISCVVMYAQTNSGKPITNLQFNNCIFETINMGDGTGSTVSIINCVTSLYGNFQLSNTGTFVKNSIIGQSNSTANINTVYENCFFGDAQPDVLPAGSNNRWGQDWGKIFNRLGGTDDSPGSLGDQTFTENYYILKAGSPAINGGFNNSNAPTNCGIYGGEAAFMYKLSGVPAVPSIYKLTAPGTSASANPYNITISVRSNN